MRKLVSIITVAGLMLLAAGCDNLNRSLLFYTQTNAGIEVGIDPASQSGKILIGYKRAEGVVNPVYIPPQKTTEHERDRCTGEITKTKITQAGGEAKKVYRKEAYSVMAKIAGEANGRGATGQAGEVEAAGKIAQWFATGEAAKLLARNEYAAAALTGSSKTAEAISKSLSKAFSEQDPLIVSAEISNVYQRLTEIDNDEAAKHCEKLDELARAYFKERGDFVVYLLDDNDNVSIVTHLQGSEADFTHLVTAQSNSADTVRVLNKILADGRYELVTGHNANGDPQTTSVTLDDLQRLTLRGHLAMAKVHETNANKTLLASPDVVNAMKYYAEYILGVKIK